MVDANKEVSWEALYNIVRAGKKAVKESVKSYKDQGYPKSFLLAYQVVLSIAQARLILRKDVSVLKTLGTLDLVICFFHKDCGECLFEDDRGLCVVSENNEKALEILEKKYLEVRGQVSVKYL